MDWRYFELHDLLCEAMIALAAGNHAAAEGHLRRALAWIEADWLATPSELPAAPDASPGPAEGGDDDE